MKRLIAGLVCVGMLMGVVSAEAKCGKCAKKAPATCEFKAGSGLSQLPDAKSAGIEAAEQALKALGKQKVKAVLVFHNKAAKGCIEGVTAVFDPSIVYGAGAYDPITEHGNKGNVGVLAIAGNVDVATAFAPNESGFEDCGKKIGEGLKDAAGKAKKGKILVLFGDCHVPKNNDVVKGVQSVLGEDLPIVGGAAHAPYYFQGKPLTAKKPNMGVLLTGNFKVGLSTKKDQSSPEACIACAGAAFTEAVGKCKDKTAMVFAMDCGGRRGTMKGQIEKELAGMKAVVGSVPIFGFYGSGEIGHADGGSPSKGVGYSIAAGAIIME